MKIERINDKTTFGNIYKYTKYTSYGKCIHGKSAKGLDYDVYVAEDKRTGNIMHKLYYITKDNKWVKSVLRFFSGNKAYKEVKSENWL
jgi:hypothetical protein